MAAISETWLRYLLGSGVVLIGGCGGPPTGPTHGTGVPSNDRLERTTRDDEFNRVFCELRRRSGRRWRASFRKAQSTTKNVVGYATPR